MKTRAAAVLIAVAAGAWPVQAQEFNADAVINKMSDLERHAYMAGVIEGLAYSRFRHDNKNTPGGKDATGMNCIYKWWHKVDGTRVKVLKAFVTFRDQYPGAIVAALARKECGDW